MEFRMFTTPLATTILIAALFAGCGDGTPADDTGDVSADTVDDVGQLDVIVEDVGLDGLTPDVAHDTTPIDVEPTDVTGEIPTDVPAEVFTCGTYDTWPSVDDGNTKFGLTMFHWNIQYVPGGLIGQWDGGTISICNDMTGLGHDECQGWSDEALTDWIIRVSFQPILDLYLAHPDWRATFEMPGLMVEVIADRHPDVFAKLQCAANSGQIEIVSIHYSDQLFLAFPSRDLKWSIEYNRKVFEDAAIPLSTVVFNQEGQSGVGKHRVMAETGYKVDVMHRNLYRYHQQADTDDGVWPVYESTGPGATDPVKVVVSGSVDPAAGVEVDWTFFDDGEVLATPGNPYLAMFTPEPDWTQVNKFIKELQDSADAGFMHTTITDYIVRLEKLGVAPHPLLPIGDSTWQPPSTEGISRWMGRMGTLGYSTHENDNQIRTDNYSVSTCLAGAALLADIVSAEGFDVTAEREMIDAGYLDLILAEVSDATGINPWMGEWVYGFEHNQSATDKCVGAVDGLLTKSSREWVLLDLETGLTKGAGTMEPQFQLAPTDEAEIPVPITFTGDGRQFEPNWADDGRVYRYTFPVGASTDPTGTDLTKRMVSLSMPLNDDHVHYSPGLIEDEIVNIPLADFDLLADRMYLPLTNGLIGLGPDLWLIKDCRTVHLAARIDTSVAPVTIEFINETTPAAGGVTWIFYVLKGTAEEALGLARLINTHPNVHFVRSDVVTPLAGVPAGPFDRR